MVGVRPFERHCKEDMTLQCAFLDLTIAVVLVSALELPVGYFLRRKTQFPRPLQNHVTALLRNSSRFLRHRSHLARYYLKSRFPLQHLDQIGHGTVYDFGPLDQVLHASRLLLGDVEKLGFLHVRSCTPSVQ